MRLCVDKNGVRQDFEQVGEQVHDINVLTVIASESYEDFAKGLQSEIAKSLKDRPIMADSKFFVGKKSTAILPFLLNGIGSMGPALAAGKSAYDAVTDPKNALTNAIWGAKKDVEAKNTCKKGLALGLIQYSKNLFQEFVNFSVVQ